MCSSDLAIVLTDALAALDCRVSSVVEAGSHVLVLLSVEALPVLAAEGDPLLRLRGRWTDGSGATLRRP